MSLSLRESNKNETVDFRKSIIFITLNNESLNGQIFSDLLLLRLFEAKLSEVLASSDGSLALLGTSSLGSSDLLCSGSSSGGSFGSGLFLILVGSLFALRPLRIGYRGLLGGRRITDAQRDSKEFQNPG